MLSRPLSPGVVSLFCFSCAKHVSGFTFIVVVLFCCVFWFGGLFCFSLLWRIRVDVRKGFHTWRAVQHGRRSHRSDGDAALGGLQDLAGQIQG